MAKIISNSFNVTPVYDGQDGPQGPPGNDGLSVQIASQSVQYAKRTAAQGPVDDPSTLTYGNYPSSLSKGDWLYSRTTVYYQYSNGTSAGSTVSYGVTYIGKDGETVVNRGVSSITEHYKASASDTGESTPSQTDWGTTMPSDWGDKKRYLWNYEKIVYTDGTITRTTASVIAVYSHDGKGISGITNYYLATSAGSGVTRNTQGWTTSVQAISPTNKYLWNYEKIEYTTGDPTYTDPHIIGTYGDKGDTGTGIASIAATFNLSKNGTSTNETTAPTDLYYNTWQSSQPAPNDTYPYVWKKEVTTYKNPTSTETKYYCIAAKGTPGKTGPMFYLCGKFPDKAPYSKDDYRCPVVYYGGEYWYLKADSATASDTPSASSSVWGKAEKFDMVFTDVLFVKDFAKLGSFVVSGDWLISTKGILGSAESQDYSKFDPAYPDSSVNTTHTVNGTTWTGYNFVPYFAVDGKEGKIYAVKGQIGGFNIGTTSLGTTTPYGQTGYTYILRDGKISISNSDNGYDYGLSVNGGAELLGTAAKKIVIHNNTGEVNIKGNPLNLNTDANNGANTNIGNAQSKVVVNAGSTTFNDQVNLSEETNVTANGVMTIQGILAMYSSIKTQSFTLPANPKVGQVFFCKSLSSALGDLVISANTGQSIMAADSRSTSTSVNIQDNSAFVVCMNTNTWVLFRCS